VSHRGFFVAGVHDLNLAVEFLSNFLGLFFSFGVTFEVTPAAGSADRIKSENQESFKSHAPLHAGCGMDGF